MKTNKLILLALSLISNLAIAADLATAKVRSSGGGGVHVAEGLVEAVRQSVIAAQVSGRITKMLVKAGDRVEKGQLLLQIDSQAAAQQAMVNALSMPARTPAEAALRARAIASAQAQSRDAAAGRPVSEDIVARVDRMLGIGAADPTLGLPMR